MPPPADEPSSRQDAVEVTPAFLQDTFALPDHADDASKGDRGTALVVGGSRQTAGAVLLAGLAALRAGAGKLQLATVAPAAAALMTTVPEALVVGLPETRGGAIDPACNDQLAEMVSRADAVLVGTGALEPDATGALLDTLTAAAASAGTLVVIDVAALPPAAAHPEWMHRLEGRGLAVPNPSEVAELAPDGDVDDPAGSARAAAERLAIVVACRGPETWIAEPGGRLYVERSGTVGLATSGSGDVAAGIALGLLARGAPPVVAAAWAARLHGRAGERAGQRIGPIGYLARELLDEVPAVLADPAA